MGKLIKAVKWAAENFEKGSRPGTNKIIGWIESGDICGRVIAGEPYIDADRFAVGFVPRSPVKAKLMPEDLLR